MSKAAELRSELLAVATAYCQARQLRLSSLGQYMLGSSTCLAELRDGQRKMVAEVYDESMQWMSDRWPADARWPPHVARPEPQSLPPKELTNGQKAKSRQPAGRKAKARRQTKAVQGESLKD